MNIEEYIKNEGYSPFASEETIAQLSKEEEKDRGLVKVNKMVIEITK